MFISTFKNYPSRTRLRGSQYHWPFPLGGRRKHFRRSPLLSCMDRFER